MFFNFFIPSDIIDYRHSGKNQINTKQPLTTGLLITKLIAYQLCLMLACDMSEHACCVTNLGNL